MMVLSYNSFFKHISLNNAHFSGVYGYKHIITINYYFLFFGFFLLYKCCVFGYISVDLACLQHFLFFLFSGSSSDAYIKHMVHDAELLGYRFLFCCVCILFVYCLYTVCILFVYCQVIHLLIIRYKQLILLGCAKLKHKFKFHRLLLRHIILLKQRPDCSVYA